MAPIQFQAECNHSSGGWATTTAIAIISLTAVVSVTVVTAVIVTTIVSVATIAVTIAITTVLVLLDVHALLQQPLETVVKMSSTQSNTPVCSL